MDQQMYKLLVFTSHCLGFYSPTLLFLSLLLSVASYFKSVLEQKAGAHLKTHTHPQTCINEHIVPGLLSTSWALALIDALTWQSCQWN